MAAVLLHEVLENAARRAPDEVALVTDAGTQTFAELADRVARGRGRDRCHHRARRPGRDPGRELGRVRRVLLRGAAGRTAARAAQPAAAPGRVASARLAALRCARPDRANRSCSSGSVADAAHAAGVETIIDLDDAYADLAARTRSTRRCPSDARRRRRLAHRDERHDRDAEAGDAHAREPARRGRRDPDRAAGAAPTTSSAPRSRSATSPGYNVLGLHRMAPPGRADAPVRRGRGSAS